MKENKATKANKVPGHLSTCMSNRVVVEEDEGDVEEDPSVPPVCSHFGKVGTFVSSHDTSVEIERGNISDNSTPSG